MNTQRTVLVAEDEANEIFLLREAFGTAAPSFDLRHVQNGKEAVDYLAGQAPYGDRTCYPVPDLLVTDLNMPLMSGLELLSWLRGQPKYGLLPAIVLTSSVLEEHRARALELGARAYHIKPARFSQLVELVLELTKSHASWEKPSESSVEQSTFENWCGKPLLEEL